ncbi:MAG: ribosome biogenesis GTPase Der [Campylobacteraceae bacterium]|nr:ribosome biogenesis GTPase Der [Campylobacteraceae bacterium]
MKTVVLIGLPNVGKSSLFNRIAKERLAITSDVGGTTRDVRYKDVEIEGRCCRLADTGGLDDSTDLFENVKKQSLKAAKEADILLFVTDGKVLPQDIEKKLFFELQKLKKPIALIINKIDNEKEEDRAWEFYQFGAQNIFAISVSHNRGVLKLLSWVASFLPSPKEELVLQDDDDLPLEEFLNQDDKSADDLINVAIIGRVNVGKSSLLNAVLGVDRAVVSEVAGTTIDPVDDMMIYKDKKLNFVDTAGIRKRGKIEGIEKYALNRTSSMLERSDIALLVLDASEPFTELDERIASLIDKYELGCIIVLNKWDKARESFEKITQDVRYKFKFLSYAPIITLSALSKQRVHKINDLIIKVYENYTMRVPTSRLNEAVKEASRKHQLPSDKGRHVKIYFATQFDTKPPRFALVMNRPKSLHFSYKRFLVNRIRDEFGFEGAPIILIARTRGEKDNESAEVR